MKELFEVCDKNTYPNYLKKLIDEYHKEGSGFSNPELVYLYLEVLIRYLYVTRPVAEHNMENILKLLGASYHEKGYSTPFWRMIRKASVEYPQDMVLVKGIALEERIYNHDIDEIFDYVETQIMKEKDREVMEEELGHLMVCKVKYLQEKNRVLRIQKEKPQKEKSEVPGLKEECQKFIREYTPEKIKAYLDRYIVGQEEAKRNISTAIYNHYLRILYPEKHLIKNNVILIGPSGCGKTELIRRIMDLVKLPIVISDFSGVVATPWKGRNKEEALLNLYYKAGKNMALAENGIVFFDEFDKIIPVTDYLKMGDLNNELQGQMLGMMEGTVMDIPIVLEYGATKNLPMNTENILFICAGAFEGLDKVVKKDLNQNGSTGFGRETIHNEEMEVTGENIKVKHLMDYGMKPELAGRIGVVSVLRSLSREDMRKILLEAEDGIMAAYKNEFAAKDGTKLTFTEEAIDTIIDRVSEMKIGARGLNTVLHDVLETAMFEVPSIPYVREVIVDKNAALGLDKPEYVINLP